MSHGAPDWSRIEDSNETGYFIGYLDTATAQAEMQRYKNRSYELLGAAPGTRLLDVGCGTGEDALALAERVGPGGWVIGLDAIGALIDEARRRARVRGDDLPVEFRVGDVHHLDLADGSVDGCRADRVFMHLEDRRQALAEMIRVTRPGGKIVVREPDWDTLVIDGADAEFTRHILSRHFDRALRHPRSGRELYRMFRQAGLKGVTVADCSTLVLTDFATADRLYGLSDAAARMQDHAPEWGPRAQDWLEGLRRVDRDGLFFSAVTGYTVVGTKPAEA